LKLRRYILWVCAAVLFTANAFAQPSNDNCANVQFLCPNNTFSVDNVGATTEVCAGCADGATATGVFCFDVDNTVWFSFMTNTTGGNADVDITGINCIGGAGQDDELQGVIIEATSPCDESTYTTVSNCEPASSGSFTLSAAALAPNTLYYVLLDGDLNGATITQAAECNFNIEVSGPAVDVTVNTTIVDQTCGLTDGEITINSVSGGQGPYTYSINGGSFQASNVFSSLTAGNYTIAVTDANGCIYTISPDEVVNLAGGITGATLNSVTGANCNDNSGEIQVTNPIGGTPPYTYSLNGGPAQANGTFSGLNSGNYLVTVFDANGCPYYMGNIVVPNSSGVTDATVIEIDPNCNASDGAITIIPIGGVSPYVYSINSGPGQGSGVFSNLAAGFYEIAITDDNGCTFTYYNIALTDQPGNLVPDVSIVANQNPICLGDNVNFNAVATNGGTAPNFEWFVNGTSVQSGSGSTYIGTFNDGDVVTVIMTSNENCLALATANSNAITITVTQPTTPTVDVVASETVICFGDNVDFTATSPDCATPSNYQWQVNGITAQTGPSDTFSSSALPDGADVVCIMTCDDDCTTLGTSTAITMSVTEISVNAGPDQVIGEGESTQLDGSSSGTYLWTPSSTLSDPTAADPVATPPETTTYILEYTENGCTVYDDVTIYVTQLIVIPNTFTPNGDGVNDTWEIFKIENYPDCIVTIYTRWGQKIFNEVGYQEEERWDGTNHGLHLPASTYYYVIDLKSEAENDVFAGSITIIY
jgi:gliding motility-associated-like protein